MGDVNVDNVVRQMANAPKADRPKAERRNPIDGVFGKVIFALPDNPKTFKDDKTGVHSRRIVSCMIQLGSSELYVPANVSARWKSGDAQLSVHITMPMSSQFVAAIRTDDPATKEAYNAFLTSTRKQAEAWLAEKVKKGEGTVSVKPTAANEVVDPAIFGLSL